MVRLLRVLGSLTIAVPLLIAIAVVLAWGTVYETLFGTASVQRFIYHAWWFQALLGFLAVNLALAALQRWPWKRQHLPFVLAHVGIILILVGGIIGGLFGVEGQMIIPEGQAERAIQLPQNVLAVHQPTPPPAVRPEAEISAFGGSAGGGANPGTHHIIPTNFETRAWVHEPNTTFPLALEGRSIQLTVDRYFPDAVTEDEITDGGPEERMAVHLQVMHQEQTDALWLVAGDPSRFGAGWGEAHILALQPAGAEEFKQLTAPKADGPSRGVVTVALPGERRPHEIEVPEQMAQPIAIPETPYRLTFKEYFPDFVITENGPATRSDAPNNPAVAFTLAGPEGTDAYLLFALHPDIASMHGWRHVIPAQVRYQHGASAMLPPRTIALVQAPSGKLAAVMTGEPGQHTVIDPVSLGTVYTHPWLNYTWSVDRWHRRAQVIERVSNRSNDVKVETLHVTAHEGEQTHAAWLWLREPKEFPIGQEPLHLEYRPAMRELPYTIKLLDFRKITYPGIDMAAGFEADVQLSDPQRGVILMRTIKMNTPLHYRGFAFYQSSYVDGPVQTTVLSVRSDPGTPLVYAGFLVVIGGVTVMFARRPAMPGRRRGRKGMKQ